MRRFTNEDLFSKFDFIIELAEHVRDVVKKFKLVKLIKAIEEERKTIHEFMQSDKTDEDKETLIKAEADIILDFIEVQDIGEGISHKALYNLQDHIKE